MDPCKVTFNYTWAIFQYFVPITDIKTLQGDLPDYIDKIVDMPSEYTMMVDPNFPLYILDHRVPTEAWKEIEAQLKEMTDQGIILPQIELTPWVCSLTYPWKENGSLWISMKPKDFNRTITREWQSAHTGRYHISVGRFNYVFKTQQ